VESVFVVTWAVVVLALGSLFTLKPAIPADVYINWMAITRLTNRLRERLAPRAALLVLYRIGGVFFLAVGVAIPVLHFMGASSFGSRH
jgi:orotate phosphoribosyltransferase-like protein